MGIKTNIPTLTTTVNNPLGHYNLVNAALESGVFPVQSKYVTVLPANPIPGAVYLIGAGGAGAGKIAVAVSNTDYVTYSVVDGTVVDGYTRVSGDWLLNQFENNSRFVATANGIFPVDAGFRGICDIVVLPGVTATFTSSLANGGLTGTVLSSGVYKCYQDNGNTVIR